tara:strand:+ start:410 stop:1132 length:723 start_codon:yes stop_codon:yes gene_type:complete
MDRKRVDFEIYKLDSIKSKPKELFKQAADLIGLFDDNNIDNKKLIDIGGANGSFCRYVRSKNKNIYLKNSDCNEKIIESCSDSFKRDKINYSIDEANSLSEKNDFYDYVVSFGVTQIFDDFIPSFSEMIRIVKPGGKICNSILVNEKDVDVIIKYIDPIHKTQIPGWNKFSIKSISNYLKNNKQVENYDFFKHKMPFDIKENKDLMRSYTKYINGERIIWNDGLNMEVTIYSILIKKSNY